MIIPCLWFDRDAEAAVDFYIATFSGAVTAKTTDPRDGRILTVEFEIRGTRLLALNGGHPGEHTDALSLQVPCDTQPEIDAIWAAILADGGEAVACGWIRDRWGLRWQVFPQRLPELLADPDVAGPVMAAMQQMVKIDLAAIEAAAEGARAG